MDKKVVWVAVGVVIQSNRVLIAKRLETAHQGGLWEFPGGKVESGESVFEALARELNEEVGLTIKSCRPLLEINHDYGDKQVCLDVQLVDEIEGVAIGKEQQQIKWVDLSEIGEYEFPAANKTIIQQLKNSPWLV